MQEIIQFLFYFLEMCCPDFLLSEILYISWQTLLAMPSQDSISRFFALINLKTWSMWTIKLFWQHIDLMKLKGNSYFWRKSFLWQWRFALELHIVDDGRSVTVYSHRFCIRLLCHVLKDIEFLKLIIKRRTWYEKVWCSFSQFTLFNSFSHNRCNLLIRILFPEQ